MTDTNKLLIDVLNRPPYTARIAAMTDAELDAELSQRFDTLYRYGAGRKLIEEKLWPEYDRRGRQDDFQRIQKERSRVAKAGK